MAAFQFRDHSIHLDIAGNLFDLPVTDRSISGIIQWGKDAQEKANQYKGRTDSQSIGELEAFMLLTLDGLLGEGASGRIFAGREPSLMDMIDIMNYITSEVQEYQKGLIGRNEPAYSPNRAQRRESRQGSFGMDVLREALNKLETESYHE